MNFQSNHFDALYDAGLITEEQAEVLYDAAAELTNADILTALEDGIEKMVNDFALHYLVAQTRARWTRRDFFDTHHLSPAGREKFVPVLADLLAPVVSQR